MAIDLTPLSDPVIGYGEQALWWVWNKVITPVWDTLAENVSSDAFLIGWLAEQAKESRFLQWLQWVSQVISPQVQQLWFEPHKVAEVYNAIQSWRVTQQDFQKIQSYGKNYTDLLNQYNTVEKMQNFVFGQGFSQLPEQQRQQHLKQFNDIYQGYTQSRERIMRENPWYLKTLETWDQLKRDTYNQYKKVLQNIYNQDKNNEDLVQWLSRSFDTFYDIFGETKKSLAKAQLEDNAKVSFAVDKVWIQTQKVLNQLTQRANQFAAAGGGSFHDFYGQLAKDPEFVKEFAQLDDLKSEANLAIIQARWFGLDDDTGKVWEALQFLNAGFRSILEPIRQGIEKLPVVGSDTRAKATSLGQLSYYSDELSKTTKFWNSISSWADRNAIDIAEFVWEAATSGWLSLLGKWGRVLGAAKYLDAMDDALKANRALKWTSQFAENTWAGMTMDSLFNYNLSPELWEWTLISDLITGAAFDFALTLPSLRRFGPTATEKQIADAYAQNAEIMASRIVEGSWWEITKVQALDYFLHGKNPSDIIADAMSSDNSMKALKATSDNFFKSVASDLDKIKNLWPDATKAEIRAAKENLGWFLEMIKRHSNDRITSDDLAAKRASIRNAKNPSDLKKIADNFSKNINDAYFAFNGRLQSDARTAMEQMKRFGAVDTELFRAPDEKGNMFFDQLKATIQEFGVNEIYADAIWQRIQARWFYTDWDLTRLIANAGNPQGLDAVWYAEHLANFIKDFAKIAPTDISNIDGLAKKITESTNKISNFLSKADIDVDFAKNIKPQYRSGTAIMSVLEWAYGGNVNQFVAAMFHEFSHGISNFVKNNEQLRKISTKVAKSYRNETQAINRMYEQIFGDGFRINDLDSIDRILTSEFAKISPNGAQELHQIAMDFYKRYASVEEYMAYSLSEYIVEGKITFDGAEWLSEIFSSYIKGSTVLDDFEEAVERTGVLAADIVKKVEERAADITKDDMIQQAARSYQANKWLNFDEVDHLSKVNDFNFDMKSTMDLAWRQQEFLDIITTSWRQTFVKKVKTFQYGDLVEVFGKIDKSTKAVLESVKAESQIQQDLMRSAMLSTLVLGTWGKEWLLAGSLLEIFQRPTQWLGVWDNVDEYLSKVAWIESLLTALASKGQMEEIDTVIWAMKAAGYNKAGTLENFLDDKQVKKFIERTNIDQRHGPETLVKELEKYFDSKQAKFNNVDAWHILYKVNFNAANYSDIKMRWMTVWKNMLNSMPFKTKFNIRNHRSVVKDTFDAMTGYVTKSEKQTSDWIFSIVNDGSKTSESINDIARRIEETWSIETLDGLKKKRSKLRQSDLNDLFDVWVDSWIIPQYKRFVGNRTAEGFDTLAKSIYGQFEPRYAEQIARRISNGQYDNILNDIHARWDDSYNKRLDFKAELNIRDVRKKDLGKFSFMGRDDIQASWDGGYIYKTDSQTYRMVDWNAFSLDATAQTELRWINLDRILKQNRYQQLKQQLDNLGYLGEWGLEEALRICKFK